jgi:hypothetical protein
MAMVGFAAMAFAQTQLPNVGFENWTNVGNNSEEPEHYNSNKTGGGLAGIGPQTCFRAGSPNTGTYSLELRTINSFGTPVNGTATTGKVQAPSTNPADGYIETLRSDPNFSWPFVGRPDSLVGYYKYLVANNDQGKVQVTLHGDYDVRNPQDANSAPYIYADAIFLTPHATVSNWTRFSVPFIYTSATTPTYALVVCTASSEAATAVNGSKMWLDDVQVVYTPLAVPDPEAGSQVQAYWQGDALVIDQRHSEFTDDPTVQLFDIQGHLLLEAALTATDRQRIPADVAPGVYVLRIVGGRHPFTQKLAKLN